MQDCLVDEDVLFLHFFNMQLKPSRQFGAVLQLRKLDHFALLNVDPQTPCLVQNVTLHNYVPFLLGQSRYVIEQSH